MNLGERIRQARENFPGGKLSQDALAEMVGVTRGAVSQWELGGIGDISAQNLYRLSLALRADFVWLLTGKTRKITEGEMSFEEIELLAMYRAMTEIGRTTAMQQIEQLCKLFKAPDRGYPVREAKLTAANNKTKQ